mgnify:CR=1 FL=1
MIRLPAEVKDERAAVNRSLSASRLAWAFTDFGAIGGHLAHALLNGVARRTLHQIHLCVEFEGYGKIRRIELDTTHLTLTGGHL